ncbi:MAG: hypothetical protein WKF31_04655 [Thermoleophilaceae bacterium]
MPHEVDTAVDGVQLTALEPVPNGTAAYSGRDELLTGDQSSLLRGDPGDGSVDAGRAMHDPVPRRRVRRRAGFDTVWRHDPVEPCVRRP